MKAMTTQEGRTTQLTRLEFATFRAACYNVDRMRRGLTDMHPRDPDLYRLFDEAGEIPWVGLNLIGDLDGNWDRLTVCSRSSYEAGDPDSKAEDDRDPFIIVVCHFPEGSLKAKNPTCTYRRVTRWEPKQPTAT